MTRLESLRALYDAVKEGRLIPNDGTLQRLFPDAWPHVFEVMRGPTEIAAPGHAIALIAATLPRWDWLVNSGRQYAMIWDADRDSQDSAEAIHPNPAIALLLACLAALIAEEERK